MDYHAKLVIPSEEAETIENLLSDCGIANWTEDERCENCDKTAFKKITYTVRFRNGCQAHVQVCPGCSPWVEIAVFDPTEVLMCFTEPEDGFFSKSCLEHSGNRYFVEVVKEERSSAGCV